MSTQPTNPYGHQPNPIDPVGPAQSYPESGYQQQDYQQPGYPQQQGYQPAGYPQQQGYQPVGYPQQQGYQPVGYPQPMKMTKSPVLGFIAAAIVAVAAVLGNASMFAMIPAMAKASSTGHSTSDSAWLAAQLGDNWVGVVLSFYGSLFLGFVALVIGIVATSTGRGRGWGIAAIVISMIGPIVTLFIVGIAAAASSY